MSLFDFNIFKKIPNKKGNKKNAVVTGNQRRKNESKEDIEELKLKKELLKEENRPIYFSFAQR